MRPVATRDPVFFGRDRMGSPVLDFLARHRIHRHTQSRAHDLPCDEIALVETGRLLVSLDGKLREIMPRHILFIPRGTRIVSRAGDRLTTAYWIGARLEQSDPLLDLPRGELRELASLLTHHDRPTPVSAATLVATRRWFELVSNEQATTMARLGAALGALGTLLESMRGTARAGEHEGNPSMLVAKALDRIDASLNGDLRVATLADACRLSRSTFVECFVAATGETPHGHIRRRRAEAARDLLVNTSLPLEAIARRVGFGSREHLSKVIRALLGASPATLRREARTKSDPTSSRAGGE